MTNKYRIVGWAPILGGFLLGQSLAVAQIPGQFSTGQPAPGQSSGAAIPSTSKLTPEERQQRKAAKLQKEMEAEQARVETFGMVAKDDPNPLAAEYRQTVADFQKATAEFADAHARIEFRLTEELSDPARENWLSALKQSFQQMVLWRNKGAELYTSDPVKYQSVGLMLREMLISDGKLDRLDRWTYGAKALLAGGQLVDEEVLLYAGYTGFVECDFELATQAWSKLAEAGKLPEQESIILAQIPTIAKAWDEELLRLQADQAKNNPRVEIVTSKGVMEIELFEDEAPESVSNFIYLVESGYYNRKPMYLVKQHWMAFTGCEKGDGKGTAGYSIRSEAQSKTHRNHFRGSLALPIGINTQTNQIDPDSGGSQFYFAFVPLPILDGKHTVFGRVVGGIETLGFFKVVNLTDEEERKDPNTRADTIVRARVLSKRDHEYKPTPIKGRLPR